MKWVAERVERRCCPQIIREGNVEKILCVPNSTPSPPQRPQLAQKPKLGPTPKPGLNLPPQHSAPTLRQKKEPNFGSVFGTNAVAVVNDHFGNIDVNLPWNCCLAALDNRVCKVQIPNHAVVRLRICSKIMMLHFEAQSVRKRPVLTCACRCKGFLMYIYFVHI